MPSKNMLPKGKRRQSVKAAYRAARDAANEEADKQQRENEALLYAATHEVEPTKSQNRRAEVRTFHIQRGQNGTRLDQFLASAIPEISRSRVKLLLDGGQVHVNDAPQKASYRVQLGEVVRVTGDPTPPPLRATPEAIPLRVVYEDDDIAVIDKPAGMMVHAGSGATDEARSGGTLVNALLHHFHGKLSKMGGELRPGIVHRLDKETSGLILVAKNDRAHRSLAEMFQEHSLTKRYIALVHGHVHANEGTISLPIGRDPVRRIRMTTRVERNVLTTASHGRPSLRAPEEPDEDETDSRWRGAVRSAVTHYRVLERLIGPLGQFTLLQLEIETGRTHQIRVHLQALGHPVAGDTLYGAPKLRLPRDAENGSIAFRRNFLHAGHLSLRHPVTGKPITFDAPLPEELDDLLEVVRGNRGQFSA